MINPSYFSQVDLLLQLLPHVAKETCFVLKGGTAINLFIRDLPRLSVDIDLTYLPLDERKTALSQIKQALMRIQSSIKKIIPNCNITLVPQGEGQEAKLICRLRNTQVKIEVNPVVRGIVYPFRIMDVVPAVEETFKRFASIQVVSEAELFGGKICAALDRQHPRDLFDVNQMFKFEGLSDDIRLGFIIALLSHGRPMHEILNPRLLDQSASFQSQFAGMALVPFTYDEFEKTRTTLCTLILSSLTEAERLFLLSFKRGNPDWNLLPTKTVSQLPAVTWKLTNIKKLLTSKPKKHQLLLKNLEQVLSKTE
jgi:predicted nucleotidyltransferase component of viral defense system